MRHISTERVISNRTRTHFCHFHHIGHTFSYGIAETDKINAENKAADDKYQKDLKSHQEEVEKINTANATAKAEIVKNIKIAFHE